MLNVDSTCFGTFSIQSLTHEIVSFSSFSQEADSLSKDFVSEGFKIHGYVMNITDIAKIE